MLIGLVVYYPTQFYFKVKKLPHGPFPLPFVGNLLFFRGKKRHQCLELIDLSKKYGPVFTFWMGPTPFVFVMDFELGKEMFGKNEFAGRPSSFFGQLVSNDKYSDILFADYGPKWQSLRRVAHTAVRKFAKTEKFADLVTDVVDQTVQLIIAREGIDRAFCPFDYIYHLYLNIMAASVFGKRYDIEDEEFKKLNYIFHDFFKEETTRLTLLEFIPIMRFIDRSIVAKREVLLKETIDLVKSKYVSHFADFSPNIVRDMSDALIQARNEALAEGKESAPYLNDDNLTMVLWDLFIAGVDTTHNTFKWLLLLLSANPDIQTKLRQEIESEIGSRMPLQEDRNRCNYIMAFISETLRFRNVAPQGVFHKAVVDTKFGQYNIPEGTGVFVHQYSILNDPKYWPNFNQFIPERFLQNGKYTTSCALSPLPSPPFIPFGLGRRVCLGEQLAMGQLFMVLVRFLQSTNDYVIRLDSDLDLEPNPVINDAIVPKEYQILLTKV